MRRTVAATSWDATTERVKALIEQVMTAQAESRPTLARKDNIICMSEM
jgi:hypothetical protein